MIHDGWDEAQLEFVSSITAPLFWEYRDDTGKDRMKNGSLFFMDAGEGIFAVTAAHVVEACLKDSESPMFQCMIGGNGPGRIIYLQLRDRIINTHHGIDVATLRVSRDEVELTDRNILTSPESSWPPSVLTQT